MRLDKFLDDEQGRREQALALGVPAGELEAVEVFMARCFGLLRRKRMMNRVEVQRLLMEAYTLQVGGRDE